MRVTASGLGLMTLTICGLLTGVTTELPITSKRRLGEVEKFRVGYQVPAVAANGPPTKFPFRLLPLLPPVLSPTGDVPPTPALPAAEFLVPPLAEEASPARLILAPTVLGRYGYRFSFGLGL